jgi:hypothetical protein
VRNSRIEERSQTTTRRSGDDDVGNLRDNAAARRTAAERPSRPGQRRRAGVGTAIGLPLASRLGRRDGVACVVDFLYAAACSLITALVWAVDGSQVM